MISKFYVTWEDVEKFMDSVVQHYKNKSLTGVFGLPRGGLIFAVMLSHRLNIPMLAAPVKGCIIVDDICDSGESLLHYCKNTSGQKIDYNIATMFYKENKLGIVPDFWLNEKGDKWIVFPWEEKED